jgi:hypothetical protein
MCGKLGLKGVAKVGIGFMCVVVLLRRIVLMERDMAGSFEHERRWCVWWFCGLSCCVLRGCVVINRETLFLCLKGRSEETDNEVLLSNTKGAGVCARSIE